jgi:hypothetical protein
MTYEYPTAKYEYDHNDKMYFIKNKQVHIVCTLNHKLYTKLRHSKSYQLIEAQNVMGKMAQMQKTMKNTFYLCANSTESSFRSIHFLKIFQSLL